MATATQITTGRVRFSYVNAFTPRAAQEGAQLKYSVTLLIPKTDKNTIAKIKAAIEAAKTAYLQKHSGKKLPSALKTTFAGRRRRAPRTAASSAPSARATTL